MKQPVVVIGLGEMGSVFARGFLRSGYPVYPVTRQLPLQQAASEFPLPHIVITAVGENDLQTTLSDMPAAWRDDCVLLQNELLPDDWKQHGIHSPTVISVWFEKKPGQDVKVIMPSPAYGRHAKALQEALGSIGIPVRVLETEAALLHELVVKNVYILTTNIAGLVTGGTVGELWSRHQPLARRVAEDVIALQEKLTGQPLQGERLIEDMVGAFTGDPEHNCMGRSAPARLQRALQLADAYGLEVPQLRRIAEERPS